jgi:two-component system sensor histidine kinase GlrK
MAPIIGRIRYPASFLQMLLLAFLLASLPLMLALADLVRNGERQAARGENAVYEAARIGRGSRVLTEQVHALERTARRYFVLNDAELLPQYEAAHRRFKLTASDLSVLQLGASQLSALNRLIDREDDLHRIFTASPPQAARRREMPELFTELADLAQAVLDEGNTLIDREVEAMRGDLQRDHRRALWLTAAAIPLAVAAAVVFAYLIARPVRQIDAAIRRLG